MRRTPFEPTPEDGAAHEPFGGRAEARQGLTLVELLVAIAIIVVADRASTAGRSGCS